MAQRAKFRAASRAARRPGHTALAVCRSTGAQQSELRVGHLGPSRQTPEYHALVALNAALGGQFTSRINQLLRETKGYTRTAPGPASSSAAPAARSPATPACKVTPPAKRSATSWRSSKRTVGPAGRGRRARPREELADARLRETLRDPRTPGSSRGGACQVRSAGRYLQPLRAGRDRSAWIRTWRRPRGTSCGRRTASPWWWGTRQPSCRSCIESAG